MLVLAVGDRNMVVAPIKVGGPIHIGTSFVLRTLPLRERETNTEPFSGVQRCVHSDVCCKHQSQHQKLEMT